MSVSDLAGSYVKRKWLCDNLCDPYERTTSFPDPDEPPNFFSSSSFPNSNFIIKLYFPFKHSLFDFNFLTNYSLPLDSF